MEAVRPLIRSLSRVSRCQQCVHSTPRRRLRISSAQPAQTLGVSQPGPPPPPPDILSEPDGAVTRKRKQAEVMRKVQLLRADPSKPASALRKRFWKEVSVKETPDGLQILLDSRPVRVASKDILTLPHSKHQLATAIALEWDLLVSAQQALKQHYIPLTALVSRAIDIQLADRKGDIGTRDDVVTMVLQYLHTDTLLCWAPDTQTSNSSATESLRSRQKRVALEIIGYLTSNVWPGVVINPELDESSIIPAAQPEATKEVIRGWISGLPAYELAALERGVLATKSLLVAVRLMVEWSSHLASARDSETEERKFGIEEAAEACSLEVRYQTDIWGEVEDTHDVEKEDLRRQLGSVVFLVHG